MSKKEKAYVTSSSGVPFSDDMGLHKGAALNKQRVKELSRKAKSSAGFNWSGI